MECLFAYSYLWAWGFCSMQEYNVHLDMKFSESPNDDVLLGLEECSDNYKDTFARLNRYFEYETNSFDYYIFGKTLFEGLKIAYKSEDYNIFEFASKCYKLWKLLPKDLSNEEPFFILCYADDPLSWGDEKQTRTLYEQAFEFYKR